MLENFILVLIALFTVLFMGLLWLRHTLAECLNVARQHQQILQSDFDRRRDMVPYLLEGAGEVGEPSDTWRKLVEDRAAFHALPELTESELQKTVQRELDFEAKLKSYLQNTPVRAVHFLDAKKDIEELGAIIEKEKQNLQSAVRDFNEQRKIFPYSLASAIFGFRVLGSSAEPNLPSL